MIFGLLALLVLIIDTLLLPTMVGQQSPPRAFFDACTAEEGGPSGMFALTTIAFSVTAFVVLKIAGSRTLAFSLTFFIGICLLQWYIGSSGGLRAVLNSPLLSTLYRWPIVCANALSNDTPLYLFLQQRYNPALNNSFSGANVPVEFTNMLAVNLVLMAAFCTVSAFTALVSRMLAAFRRRSREKVLSSDERLLAWLSGPERTSLIQNAILVLLAIAVAPILVLWSTSPDVTTPPINNFLWAGSLVVMIDLARLLLMGRSLHAVESTKVDKNSDEASGLILKSVYSAIIKRRSEAIAAHFELPAQREQAPAVTKKGEELDSISNGEVKFLFETLNNNHFETISDIIDTKVLDTGRAALVICPQDALEEFASDLEERFDNADTTLKPVIWRVGRPRSDEHRIDFFIVSPELLDTLVAKQKEVAEELSRLGGIFILALHRLDVGLLNLGLARFQQAVDAPSEMVAVVQSEQRRDLRNWIKNMPLLRSLNTQGGVVDSSFGRKVPGYTILLDPVDASTAELHSRWPIGARALFDGHAVAQQSGGFIFDMNARHAKSVWQTTVVEHLHDADRIAEAKWAGEITAPVLIPTEHPHPIGLLEDNGNLVDMMGIGIASESSREALRLIVRGTYPGSTFLRDRLEHAIKSGTASSPGGLRTTLTDVWNLHGSIIPTPGGGPLELALMVRQEYQTRGLTQSRLDAIWAKQSNAISQLGITNSRIGLERLLRQTLRISDNKRMVSRKETENRTWAYSIVDQSLASSEVLAALPLSFPQLVDLPGVNAFQKLALADHGLSYAEGTRIILNGSIYKLQSVQSSKDIVFVEADDERPLRPYVFVRDYRISTGANKKAINFAVDKRHPPKSTDYPTEIVTGYARISRQTSAFREFANVNQAFESAGTVPSREDVSVASEASLRSIAILRAYQPEERNANRKSQKPQFGRKQTQDSTGSEISGLVAFTLAATLQDVLAMLFPALAHRIAVVSLDAFVVAPRGEREWDNVSAFALDRHPGLLPPTNPKQDGKEERTRERHQLKASDRAKYSEFFDAFIAKARQRLDADPVTGTALSSMAVIEDSDHELGVANSFLERFAEIREFWAAYLEHCERIAASDREADYSFGSGRLPVCFAFDEALKIVKGMG